MAGPETDGERLDLAAGTPGHTDTAGGAAGDGAADGAGSGTPAAGGLWTATGVTGRVAAPLQAVEAAVTGWRHNPRGESRWPVVAAVTAAVALQLVLPNRFTPGHRLVPALELALLIGTVIAHPGRITGVSRWLRPATLVVVAMISATNAWSLVRLVAQIVAGQQDDALVLLSSGAAIWATNVIVFGLWYWELDRGGPGARARGDRKFPDFSFPQMQNPELAPPGWAPRFADYLYVSFTNACAFSPTDVMPLARWAKMAMLGQSVVSLITVVLVVARAIGLFK